MENNKYNSVGITNSGLRYFVEEHNAFPSVSFGVFVRSGSRYEDGLKRGISHFLEHTVFKGTKTRSAYEISREIEKLGGELNAYTSPEYTLFYVKLLSKHVEKGFDILSDIVKDAVFDKELIERERRVVLEEIQEYLDSPEDICQTEALHTIWDDELVANNPLGTVESVSSITRDDLDELYKKLFNKENMFLSVAGDISHKHAEELIEKYFSDVNSRAFTPQIELPHYHFETRSFKKDSTQVHIAVTLKGYRSYSRESLMQSVYTTLIGGNMSSRLFQKLREQKGLVYTIYTYPVRFIDTGGTVIYASTIRAHKDEVISDIEKELDSISKNGVREDEFTDAREYVLGSVLLGLESLSSRMQRNGAQGLFLGKVRKISALTEEIEKIGYKEFNEFARTISNSERGRVVVGDIDE
jgi:predicted Zn-dependent peptidase